MNDVVEREDNNPFRRNQDAGRNTSLTEAMAQREVTEVQSALVIARKFPRDQVRVMDLILNDCTLPALAEAATYEYSRGGSKITGPSIRLAEAVARRWGNIMCGVKEISRSEGSSECKAYAWDLESGYYEERTFQVPHWRDTRDGGHPLTDERDIYELVANMGARRKRACILAVIPLDVFDRAGHVCEVTLKSRITVDDETLAGLLEKLAEFGVTKEMIEKRIQRRYAKESVTPGMILQLRRIYNSLFDKASVIGDWFKGDKPETDPSAAKTPSGRKTPRRKEKGKDETLTREENSKPLEQLSAEATKLAEPSEINLVREKMSVATISDVEVCKAFGIKKLEELRKAVVPAVMRWLSDPMQKPDV